MPRQHRLGLGAKPLSKEQIKKLGNQGDDFDGEALHKRLGVTQEYELGTGQNGGGRNFKGIHDKLQLKERMKLGSYVIVTSGTHESLEGRIVAVVDSKSKQQSKMMGDLIEKQSEEIDPEAYVSVELKINGSIVNIKRKRLLLKSKKDLLAGKSRSRSRSQGDEKNRCEQKKKLRWVIPGIVIRVVSKKVADGVLYNKKLRVTDVLS